MHGNYLIWQLLGYNLKKLLSCLTLPLNLSECNISCKKTFLNIESNLSYLSIFRLELEKTTVLWYFTSTPSNFSKHTISPKKKILKFGTKIAVIEYFGLEFQKTNAVFEISILEFVNMQRFIQNQKNLNL